MKIDPSPMLPVSKDREFPSRRGKQRKKGPENIKPILFDTAQAAFLAGYAAAR